MREKSEKLFYETILSVAVKDIFLICDGQGRTIFKEKIMTNEQESSEPEELTETEKTRLLIGLLAQSGTHRPTAEDMNRYKRAAALAREPTGVQ